MITAIISTFTVIIAFFHYSLNAILKIYIKGISSYLLRLIHCTLLAKFGDDP